jgi:hypothetical protein
MVIRGIGSKYKNVGILNQRFLTSVFIIGMLMLTITRKKSDIGQDVRCAPSRPFLGDTVSLHHQPGGSEERIPEYQRNSRHHAVRIEPVERSTGKASALDLKSANESSQCHTLHEGSQKRPEVEGVVLQAAGPGRLEAELKGNASENEPQEHEDHRYVKGRH